MDNKDPFSQESLNDIFRLSTKNPDRVKSRESGTLEFKESFGWQSIAKYLRSCAAFANTKGGYLVFGVKDKPHVMKGLVGKRLEAFESLDPAQFTGHLNEHFSPEIKWNVTQYELNSKIFGILYIDEAVEKPVICRKTSGDELRESDIYYRYRGRTERIKYPELHEIIMQSREKERQIWMKHLESISRIGVQNAGVFDLQSGTVEGASGAFLIDESLLDRLTFIREGEFSPTQGAPTLKLLGELSPISTVHVRGGRPTIVKSKGIRVGDIVNAFLEHQSVPDAEEYVRQICYESSSFLPVYYFLKQAKLNVSDTVAKLEGVMSRLPAKDKLIDRLKSRTTNQQSISNADNPSSKKKREYAEKLRTNTINKNLTGEDLKKALQAIRGLTKAEVKNNSAYLRGLLKAWFNKHYEGSAGPLADNLRRAICWVDEALYQETVS